MSHAKDTGFDLPIVKVEPITPHPVRTAFVEPDNEKIALPIDSEEEPNKRKKKPRTPRKSKMAANLSGSGSALPSVDAVNQESNL